MKKKIVLSAVIGFLAIASGITIFTLWKHHQQELTTIAISRDGSLSRAGRQLDAERLGTNLKELAAKGQVVTIRADIKTDPSRLVEILNACRAADVTEVKLATAMTR